jgi:hypothetical protein
MIDIIQRRIEARHTYHATMRIKFSHNYKSLRLNLRLKLLIIFAVIISGLSIYFK